MNYRSYRPDDAVAVVDLFTSVFTDSEGEEEGVMVGGLAQDLVTNTDAADLLGFVAEDSEEIVAAIMFSRLVLAGADESTVSFLLSPVAVHQKDQGQGIGQRLIRSGLESLKADGVKCVITYGDPRFYAKVGFRSLLPERVQPPFPLSQPHGWLGQDLQDAAAIDSLEGKCGCVSAFNDPRYW